MCVLLVFVVCFGKSTNSTVVDRELTPWFFWLVYSGSFNGVLLESVKVIVMVWIVFSLWKGRSAGRAISFYVSSRTGLVIHCCGLRTLFGLWMKNIYREFNEVRDIFFGRYSALIGVNIYWWLQHLLQCFALALEVWRSSSWM